MFCNSIGKSEKYKASSDFHVEISESEQTLLKSKFFFGNFPEIKKLIISIKFKLLITLKFFSKYL